jgi:hypothetical protein
MYDGVPMTAPCSVRPAPARAAPGRRRLDLGQVLGQAPVDHDGLAELADQHVRRLEVAVDDLLAVRIGDRLRRGEHVRQQAQPLVEGAPLADQLGERAPRHQLHRVERVAGGPAPRLVDRHDRRVLQPRRQQRLAHEPLLLRRAPDQQLLDRHRPIEAAVAGPQHPADAALGHLLRDRVRVARDAREVRRGPRVGLRVGGGERALVADRRGRRPPLMRP